RGAGRGTRVQRGGVEGASDKRCGTDAARAGSGPLTRLRHFSRLGCAGGAGPGVVRTGCVWRREGGRPAAMDTATVRRVFSTRLPTKWGLFRAIGYERDITTGPRRGETETAIAMILGNLSPDAPDDSLLVRIHSQCFTGEMLSSLRCDCADQLE